VESRAVERDSIVTSRCGAVAAARPVGIWERKKNDGRKSGRHEEEKGGSRSRSQSQSRTCLKVEKNFDVDHNFTYIKNIVVQPKL
jgi:hypothetical protein